MTWRRGEISVSRSGPLDGGAGGRRRGERSSQWPRPPIEPGSATSFYGVTEEPPSDAKQHPNDAADDNTPQHSDDKATADGVLDGVCGGHFGSIPLPVPHHNLDRGRTPLREGVVDDEARALLPRWAVPDRSVWALPARGHRGMRWPTGPPARDVGP